MASRSAYPVVLYPSEIMNWTEDFVNRIPSGASITGRSAASMERDGTPGPVGLVSGISGSGTELVVILDATVGETGRMYYVDLKATLSSSEIATQRLALSIVRP